MNIRVKKTVDFYVGNLLIFSLRPLVSLIGRIWKREHSTEVRGDIAVLKLLGGGSLVIALPALLGIRQRYPNSKIILITTPSVKPFGELLRVFDEIILIDDRRVLSMLLSTARAWARCLFIDTLIDLEIYSKLSTVFSLFTCARNRIGFYMEDLFWRKRICTHLIYFNRFAGVYLFYEQVAYLLAATPESMAACRDHLQPSLSSTDTADSIRRVSIGFACSDFGRERMLTPWQWTAFFKKRILPGERARLFFLGVLSNRELANQIIIAAKSELPQCEFVDETGAGSLERAVKLIWSSNEFWGIDSGLLHFARLARVATTSFWGPTDPQTRLKPVEGLDETVHYRRIPCSPCIHISDTPPCAGDNKCIQKLFDETLVVDSHNLLFTSWPKHE